MSQLMKNSIIDTENQVPSFTKNVKQNVLKSTKKQALGDISRNLQNQNVKKLSFPEKCATKEPQKKAREVELPYTNHHASCDKCPTVSWIENCLKNVDLTAMAKEAEKIEDELPYSVGNIVQKEFNEVLQEAKKQTVLEKNDVTVGFDIYEDFDDDLPLPFEEPKVKKNTTKKPAFSVFVDDENDLPEFVVKSKAKKINEAGDSKRRPMKTALSLRRL